MEQELLNHRGHLSSPSVLVGTLFFIFVFCVVFCRLLFVILSFSYCLFCCLFLDLRILITSLISSNVSYKWQRLRDDFLPTIDNNLKRALDGMTQLVLLTKNHRFLKNNIFGEFVITIYRNIQPTFSRGFIRVRVIRCLVFRVVFCRLLFVLLSFFSCPLCCLFLDLRILINSLISSNCSYKWHSDYWGLCTNNRKQCEKVTIRDDTSFFY